MSFGITDVFHKLVPPLRIELSYHALQACAEITILAQAGCGKDRWDSNPRQCFALQGLHDPTLSLSDTTLSKLVHRRGLEPLTLRSKRRMISISPTVR